MPVPDIPFPQTVRSFKRRQGRMSEAQHLALVEIAPRYVIPLVQQTFDFDQAFARTAPLHIEIGFGNGLALLTMAKDNPQNNYLGIEVHNPGVATVLLQIEQLGLKNIRLMRTDAVDVLKHMCAPGSVTAMYIFFPDPWHKLKHRKRRLIQPEFVTLMHERLAPGALLHMATDWHDYARQMLKVTRTHGGFDNLAEAGEYVARPAHRPLTKFEQRGVRLGHGVWDLMFIRNHT